MLPSPYRGYRFPPEIISYAVWLYHRFCLSFRDVEELLAERGITVSYEAIRQWCLKFGASFTKKLRHRQGRLGDTWYLDEMFVPINGELLLNEMIFNVRSLFKGEILFLKLGVPPAAAIHVPQFVCWLVGATELILSSDLFPEAPPHVFVYCMESTTTLVALKIMRFSLPVLLSALQPFVG